MKRRRRRGNKPLTPLHGARGHDARMHEPATPALDRAPAWTFFRQWLKNPLRVASIAPSGRQLARMMVAELQLDARRVVELGGGTGVFTKALLRHGIANDDLMVLELSSELHAHLVAMFPRAHIVQGDARELAAITADSGWAVGGPADAVISGLGMLSMPRQLQHQILSAAFACMAPRGRFVQFTYGPSSPVVQDVLDALDLETRRGPTAWLNLPPASVYVYTRRG